MKKQPQRGGKRKGAGRKRPQKTPKGRGKRGEVVWHRSIINQDGKVVQEGEIATLVECRPLSRPTENGTAEPAAVGQGAAD